MLINRTALIVSCLMLAAATGCGGGPTAPGGSGGTTIAGTVNVSGGAASAPGGAASGLTVTIVGTNLSAVVETSGFFQLVSVPSGNVRLLFKDAIVNATADLNNVGEESLIEIQVQVSNTTATIVSELRTDSKVSLCHRSDESYHQISVSENAEPAHRAHGDGKVGDPVPADTTKVFGENCQVAQTQEEEEEEEEEDDEEGPKVQLCHRTGNGSYHLIDVSMDAEPAHRAHGDGKIGEAVPGAAGKVFGAGCSVS